MRRRIHTLAPLSAFLLLATACTTDPEADQFEDLFTVIEDSPEADLSDVEVQRLFTPEGTPVDPAHIIEPDDAEAPPPPPPNQQTPARPAPPAAPAAPAAPARSVPNAAPAPSTSPRLYLRSPVPPGKGAPRALSWKVRDLEEHGFTRLDIDISPDGQNAAAQFPVTTPDTPPEFLSQLIWRAYGLHNTFETDDRCELEWFFTDETGEEIPFADEETGSDDSCTGEAPLIIPQAGPLTLHLTVRHPDFEPVTLLFSILAVE